MKRAEDLINATYGADCPPAIRSLVEFAAQNSGIEPRNYFDPSERYSRPEQYQTGWLAFKQEQNSISADWKRFKLALATAAKEGVSEAQIVEAGSRDFSGRLMWHATARPHWDYCTGQYFPTEYRKAAASVVEQAIRAARQAREPASRHVGTIKELQALNEENGGCWFGKGEMAFFGTRIESDIIKGAYFVTSEQPPHGPRMFSVRSFDHEGSIDTVGEFCAYSSRTEALEAISELMLCSLAEQKS